MKSVVIPVAGNGSRLLPLTKAIPKELLPVFDKPVLQFAIDEAIEAGAERLVIVTHPDKPAIRDYFSCGGAKAATYREKGKAALAEALEQCGAPKSVEVVFAEQREALGLGHAVLCAADDVLDGPVGVILPDDVIFGAPCLAEMIGAYTQGNMVAAMAVHWSKVSSYGIFSVNSDPEVGMPVPASGLIEKPQVAGAPSNMAAVGRYILDSDVFDVLRRIPRGAGGEYQLTDAIAAMIETHGLKAFRFSGERHDCGDLHGLMNAGSMRFERSQDHRAMATAAE